MAELELSPEAAKLMTARKSAIAELKAIDGKDRTIADTDVVRVSNARLMVDALTMRMLEGVHVSPSDLAHADELVSAALVAAGQRAIVVKLEILSPPLTRCPSCGERFDPEPCDKPVPSPSVIDGKAVELPMAVISAPVENNAPRATASPAIKPLTEEEARQHYLANHLKRLPGTGPSLANGVGSLCWYGTGADTP